MRALTSSFTNAASPLSAPPATAPARPSPARLPQPAEPHADCCHTHMPTRALSPPPPRPRSYGTGFRPSDTAPSPSGGGYSFASLTADGAHNLLANTDCVIPGLTASWLYFGAPFATFCWHIEDDALYSLNYHHGGHPKMARARPGLIVHVCVHAPRGKRATARARTARIRGRVSIASDERRASDD